MKTYKPSYHPMRITLDMAIGGGVLLRMTPDELHAYIHDLLELNTEGVINERAQARFKEYPVLEGYWHREGSRRETLSETRRKAALCRSAKPKKRQPAPPPLPLAAGASDSPEPAPAPRVAESLAHCARRVFAYWQNTMNHPRAKMDDKLQTLIERRLRDGFTEQDLCDAIDGCKRSPHHMGQNESRTVYDSLSLILRDADHINRFIGYLNAAPQQGATGKTLRNHDAARAFAGG